MCASSIDKKKGGGEYNYQDCDIVDDIYQWGSCKLKG